MKLTRKPIPAACHVQHWLAAIHAGLALTIVTIGLLTGCNRSNVKEGEPVVSAAAESSKPVITIPIFEDHTARAGLEHVYDNGESAGVRSIVESLGGGLGVLDYDADGFDDLFFPGGGKFVPDLPLEGLPNSLWRNLGGTRFENMASLASVEFARHYTHGCSNADFDADGFTDVLVTGYGGLQLFRNQGDGTYEDVTIPSGMTDDQWSSSAAWADLNNDGNLDAFITHYVDWSWSNNPKCAGANGVAHDICSPQDFKPLLDLIYFSNADGTFKPADKDVGIDVAGKGLGVVAFDANGDSHTDIYVANDTTNNFLFVNEGEGKFTDEGVISGTALDQRGVSNGSMGVAVFDYNSDLQPDIWVTNYENETFALYHNDNGGSFRCLTESTGVTALGTLYVGFGTVTADFTRSGNEDIVVSNGHVMQFPAHGSIQQNALYLHNNGRGKINQLELKGSYFTKPHRGRGVVYTDFNRDGKLDLAFSHTNEPAALLLQESDLGGAWYAVKLVGKTSNRDAIGARATLTVGDRQMMRTVVGGGSYLSQNTYDIWFGVPENTKSSGTLVIEWPVSGIKQTVTIPANQHQTIVENN